MTQRRQFEWKTLMDWASSHDGQAALGLWTLDSSWTPSHSPPCFLPISSLVVWFSVSFLSCLKLFWFCPGLSSLLPAYAPLVTSTSLFSKCSLQIGDPWTVFFQQNSLVWTPDFLSVCLFSTPTSLSQGSWIFVSEGQEQRRWGDTLSTRSKKPQ